MRDKDRLNIVYLGYSSFPYGLAEFQRILLISKALVNEGASVKVIGSRGYHNRELRPGLKKIGHFQGIVYIYSWGTPYRISGFLKRNLRKPFEKILEFIVLYRLNKKEKIDAAIISSMDFRQLFFYRIFSRILGFKFVLSFVEHNSSMTGRKEIKLRINDFFFDRYAVKISDGILVISEFLIDIIKKSGSDKPFFKIPMMVDMDRYNGMIKSPQENYFLFCGAAGYSEIIFFIINSFGLTRYESTFLYLVVNGNPDELAKIEKFITGSGKSKLIKLISNMSDQKLSELYLNATALLIPLRPTNQDTARFPHKFGEYLGSGNPVITTNNGEVKYYFKDMVNALVAESYDEIEFAAKMDFVVTNRAECVQIGMNGKIFAQNNADYRNYGKKIVDFVDKLKYKGRSPNETV